MTTVSIDLEREEVERLAELAKREGKTPEALAADAVRSHLDDAAWRAEVEAGMAEIDAGHSETFEDFEREMDAFMNQLRAARG
jgi:predicted transcriptional regulator